SYRPSLLRGRRPVGAVAPAPAGQAVAERADRGRAVVGAEGRIVPVVLPLARAGPRRVVRGDPRADAAAAPVGGPPAVDGPLPGRPDVFHGHRHLRHPDPAPLALPPLAPRARR